MGGPKTSARQGRRSRPPRSLQASLLGPSSPRETEQPWNSKALQGRPGPGRRRRKALQPYGSFCLRRNRGDEAWPCSHARGGRPSASIPCSHEFLGDARPVERTRRRGPSEATATPWPCGRISILLPHLQLARFHEREGRHGARGRLLFAVPLALVKAATRQSSPGAELKQWRNRIEPGRFR